MLFAVVIHLLMILLKDDLSDELNFAMLCVLSLSIGLWNNLFLETWRKQEMAFAMEYGQENFYKEDATRSSFYGKFVRSPVNDDMNDLYYPESKRNLTTVINYTLSFLIILAALVSVFYINVLKDHLTQIKFADNNQMLIQNIPAFATAF